VQVEFEVLARAVTRADLVFVSSGGDKAHAVPSPLSSQGMRVAIAAWALAGVAGGVLASKLVVEGLGPWRAVVPIAGFATGAALGLSGFTALSAGLLAYALAAALAQIPGGVGVTGTWLLLLTGTEIALPASFFLLLGAGARQLARPGPGGPAGGPGADAAPPAAPAPKLSRANVSRWAVYWLLAAAIFPVINLVADLRIISVLGPGGLLLGFPLLLVGESIWLRRHVRDEASSSRRLGLVATVGLVFATTVLWSFAVVLIVLAHARFTS
jgi:hypothetical protein